MRGLPHIAGNLKIEIFQARSRDCSSSIVANSINGHQSAFPVVWTCGFVSRGNLLSTCRAAQGSSAALPTTESAPPSECWSLAKGRPTPLLVYGGRSYLPVAKCTTISRGRLATTFKRYSRNFDH